MSTSESKQDQIPAVSRSHSLLEDFVCAGLGYCCPYAFFRLFKQTGLIAVRLGLSERTIRWWKAKVRTGAVVCDKRCDCQIKEIRSMGK